MLLTFASGVFLQSLLWSILQRFTYKVHAVAMHYGQIFWEPFNVLQW